MSRSIDRLRRDAKALKKAHMAGDVPARQRIAAVQPRPDGTPLKHADYLHVVARENGFDSWPALKLAAELHGMDRAARRQRLKLALFHGQAHVIDRLLEDDPELAEGTFALQVALYDKAAVEAALADDPDAATRAWGPRRPMCHLAFSRYIHARPDLEADMLAIADLLVAHGADVDDSYPAGPDTDHRLSALYGAIGHADNMVLARWLLERGANPNDGESLYHATELGHHRGLDLLLAHWADPAGTNALLRAMDFNDHSAVRKLLAAGADPNEGFAGNPDRNDHVTALHQAARRMNDAEMARILLDAGANPHARFDGLTPYELARVYGNTGVAVEIERAGGKHALSGEVAKLGRIAAGEELSGEWIDPALLPDELRNMVRAILHQPGALAHVRRLVAAGAEYDRPDDMGLTPVQIAGWEGLPDVMAYFLSLKSDLAHVNGYGGTLLSTIIHGSENNPARDGRDYLACLRLALEEGVALPRQAIEFAGDPDVAAFLRDWAEAYPGQVVDGGPG